MLLFRCSEEISILKYAFDCKCCFSADGWPPGEKYNYSVSWLNFYIFILCLKIIFKLFYQRGLNDHRKDVFNQFNAIIFT